MEQEMVQVMEGHPLHLELFGHWYAGYKQYRVYTSTQCCAPQLHIPHIVT